MGWSVLLVLVVDWSRNLLTFILFGQVLSGFTYLIVWVRGLTQVMCDVFAVIATIWCFNIYFGCQVWLVAQVFNWDAVLVNFMTIFHLFSLLIVVNTFLSLLFNWKSVFASLWIYLNSVSTLFLWNRCTIHAFEFLVNIWQSILVVFLPAIKLLLMGLLWAPLYGVWLRVHRFFLLNLIDIWAVELHYLVAASV